jgi:hypothetical protein
MRNSEVERQWAGFCESIAENSWITGNPEVTARPVLCAGGVPDVIGVGDVFWADCRSAESLT